MVTVWEAGCNFCQWTVEVLYDREGKMYLHTGWKKFARDHYVKVDRLFNFFYGLVFEMIVNVPEKEA
jgi:hypothetical protein